MAKAGPSVHGYYRQYQTVQFQTALKMLTYSYYDGELNCFEEGLSWVLSLGCGLSDTWSPGSQLSSMRRRREHRPHSRFGPQQSHMRVRACQVACDSCASCCVSLRSLPASGGDN